MWIILGALLSFSTWALEPFESIKNVKILRVLPDNVLMLNRGLEDGIQRNDHAKLSSETEGYGARAICIRTSMSISYWKLYRVPNAEAFSLDYVYTINGLADREIPFPQVKIRDARQEIQGLEEKTSLNDAGPNPFAIETDLPQQLTEKDILKATGPEKRKLFIEKTLNKDLLKRDLKDYEFSIYASPFTKQSINQGESIVYGFRGGNVGTKYKLFTEFQQQQTKLKDPLTKESVSTRSTYGSAEFNIHLTPLVSFLSIINYNSQRFSALATPKSHWQVGPIGFTWHLYESKTWEYLDLSYVPLYDVRSTEIIDQNGNKSINKKNGLRHGVRLALRTRINERVALENKLWVRPYQDLGSGKFEGDNLNLVNDLKLVFNLTNNLFLDYNLIVQKDKLWKTLSNLPETNTINSLNFRYDFSL